MILGLIRLANARWRIDVEIDLLESCLYALLEDNTKKRSRRWLWRGKIVCLFQYQREKKGKVIQKESVFANQGFAHASTSLYVTQLN